MALIPTVLAYTDSASANVQAPNRISEFLYAVKLQTHNQKVGQQTLLAVCPWLKTDNAIQAAFLAL